MHHQQLPRQWQLELAGGNPPTSFQAEAVPATVPGCVHTDLMSAGLIPDPYLDRNETLVQWISQCDWRYRCSFHVGPDLAGCDVVELVADGLDTIATVELNGQTVGQSDNMHHPFRWPVKESLVAGPNELTVTFASPVRCARDMAELLGPLPYLNTAEPFNAIRKMACNFGWDWGPVLTTSGIWKPIRLVGWSHARLDSVRPLVASLSDDRARLDVHADLVRDGGSTDPVTVEVTVTSPTGLTFTEQTVLAGDATKTVVPVSIDAPQRWWPVGYGDQLLYDLRVVCRNAAGDVLDETTRRVGLRTVQLSTREDDIGQEFTVKVNGQPVWCKGANWIPDDCFLNRACDPGRYRARIQQAMGCGMNMLRVWGGGIYETDAFYDICDELGMLVWQDFLFACAAYAEEEPLRSQVIAEARHNVARLSSHPSLVLWNGCNENVWGYCDWGWKDREDLAKRTWGLGYYQQVLPEIVAELDPSRPYWPASPYSGSFDPQTGPHPNEASRGNKHVWDVGVSGDYRNYVPRFASEFGWQGPANWATWAECLPQAQLRPYSPGMDQHQKSKHGNDKNTRNLQQWFDEPEGFDEWHFLMQLAQARSLSLGVQWLRAHQPTCMGSVYWQLNDCWPVTSWAAIDSAGRCKLLWYATRRFYAPRLLTIQPDGEHLAVYASNDTDQRWIGYVQTQRRDFAGAVLAQEGVELDVPPRSTVKAMDVPAHLAAGLTPSSEMLCAQSEGVSRAFWFFKPDRELHYPQPNFKTDLHRHSDDWELTITARTFCRELCVQADRLDPRAVVSDQMITLLPGEAFTFHIASDVDLNADALSRPPVLQCVNPFGKGEMPYT